MAAWLHGGPGGAETPLFRLYNRELEQTFVVVYWDQRGAGRSFDQAADPSRLTIDRHLADLDRVVTYVCAELGVDRVALLGHSWGSALGLLYAQRHPDKVAAFVGVNQLVDETARQQSQLDFALSRAREEGDERAVEQINGIGNPPFTAEQELAAQNWVDRYGGLFHNRPSFLGAVVSATLRGYVRPWEIPAFIRANNLSLQAMMEELAALDLHETVPAVDVPVLFALGRHDRQVDSRLAAEYFRLLDAPGKGLVWFEGSAHNVPFEEPARFNQVVREFLLRPHGGQP
jgi:pimeloyl-ACP methyl ester carboxylesterase